jgi:Polyketide cyclase / dehydrase and lipid transport
MTVSASATTIIKASPREVLECVLDLNRYKLIDRKIVRVGKVIGPDDAGRGYVRIWGRVLKLPPAPDRQDFVLERWSRLTFRGAKRQPGRLVFDFTGHFECRPSNNGSTEVTHSYEFVFTRPFRVIENRLGPWLQRELDVEIENLAAALSSAH